MSDSVKAQYEAFPYPERAPGDEAMRLITGSPSWPQEMDHWLWGGMRDWSAPLRILVAGGGTGDGLIQLASCLDKAGHPHHITYLDLSTAARKVAEARARARGLTAITFVTGSLLDAGAHGPFDYIDCCGVLHHLPEPQAGFDALAGALAPGGGMGIMVYAPLGRSGVYPLQEAFGTLFADLPPKDRLLAARDLFAGLPKGHPFKRNPHLVDHNQSDAGFYDLLLHSTDRPYTLPELAQTLEAAGLTITGMPEPALYDLGRLMPVDQIPAHLDATARMGLAEHLRGTFKTHVVYAARAGETTGAARPGPGAIPHLRGLTGTQAAQQIAKRGQLNLTLHGEKFTLSIPKRAAPFLGAINGQRSLGQIAQMARLDPLAFNAIWAGGAKDLAAFGLLHYSTFLRGGR